MQADQLAEFGKPDPFAMARDLLEDRKGAAERLHAAALAILGVVVDVWLARFDQPGDRGLARLSRLLARLRLGARLHESLPMNRCRTLTGRLRRCSINYGLPLTGSIPQ